MPSPRMRTAMGHPPRDGLREERAAAATAVAEQRSIAAETELTRVRIEAVTRSLREVTRYDDARLAGPLEGEGEAAPP